MSVRDYFKNKNIFITGGSGFIGKVLVEKILRTIPEIGNIYFLLRPKKGKSPEERLRNVFENEAFDNLRKNNPDFLHKIILIEGDVQQPKLGISEKNRKILIENVDIIYHSAASIRFDDSLCSAVLINVRSTREVTELALEAKHLKVFVHVSTAYSNSDKRVVEEKLYPSFGDWREAIRLAEEGDRNISNSFTEKYIYPSANTYVYAKLLAEQVVNDMCRGKIPGIIVRPSIVTCASFEPIPGWTDNLNGPMGLFYAGATGLLRTLYGDGDTILDCVPVDGVVNALILTAYEKMKNPSNDTIEVYNNSAYDIYKVTLQDAMDTGLQMTAITPPTEMMWYPYTKITTNKLLYFVEVVLYHVIPALLLDSILVICGKKRRVFNLHKKIYIANTVVSRFMLNTWIFENHKTMAIARRLTEEEVATFGIEKCVSYVAQNLSEYLRQSQWTIERLFELKNNRERNMKNYWRFWLLDIVARIFLCIFFIWFVRKTDLLGKIYQRLENYVSRL